MVHRITIRINSLPKKNGIHPVLSPREIVTGKKFRLELDNMSKDIPVVVIVQMKKCRSMHYTSDALTTEVDMWYLNLTPNNLSL
jgi:hypothetical protein